jgi:hypothetical protein
MIQRTNWMKKYTSTILMPSKTGPSVSVTDTEGAENNQKEGCSVSVTYMEKGKNTQKEGRSTNVTFVEGAENGPSDGEISQESGVLRSHLVLFEQAALGVCTKLNPARCKNPSTAQKVEELQEKLILILHQAMEEYNLEKGSDVNALNSLKSLLTPP